MQGVGSIDEAVAGFGERQVGCVGQAGCDEGVDGAGRGEGDEAGAGAGGCCGGQIGGSDVVE